MKIPAINLPGLPLWAAAVPLGTVVVCYLIAVGLEHVPACIPNFSGCTSVSSTGRMLPESLVFRAGMLPTALVLVLFWWRCAAFLSLGGHSGVRLAMLRILGVIVALSLVIYALTLGLEDDGYPQLRRAGIVGFALATFVAQVLLISCYRPMRIVATRSLLRWLIVLCWALPLLGIAAEVAKWAGVSRHAANNIVAWNAFVVASAYYAVVARIWRHHGFTAEFRMAAPGHMDGYKGDRQGGQ
ncbi:MAG: hypothetical protein IIB74_01115 [Proteobacteria bacterium]|nr:hypothetical protein [Pseudomonadota bacterium]